MSLKFPYQSGPRDYQKLATQNWLDNGCVGFFEMATGTGKTLTALNCALELYKLNNYVQVLVLVPTLTLSEQWKENLEDFGFTNIVLANGGNHTWPNKIMRLVNSAFTQSVSFAIVSTYATFLTKRFQSIIERLDSKTMLIADEAHNFGTDNMINNYPKKIIYRLGLSATPKRYFDEVGTQSLLRYFKSSNGITFSLGMKEAIRNGFLSDYYYHPKIVKLTSEEIDEYKQVSKQLMRFFDNKTKQLKPSDNVTKLLLRRKRIIHKAHNKLDVLREVFTQLESSPDMIKYTLVYVPEGNDPNQIEDDIRLIDQYAEVIAKEFGLSQHQIIGETNNRKEILNRFAKGDLQVLTAMKCLDEGINIERTETAIFCSSTGNPRQFIQRRGRILRKHNEKKFAKIYDMVVVPDIKEVDTTVSIALERNLLKTELQRVHEFAGMALNKYEALQELEDVAKSYSINIYSE